jgi:hypothetical protein
VVLMHGRKRRTVGTRKIYEVVAEVDADNAGTGGASIGGAHHELDCL